MEQQDPQPIPRARVVIIEVPVTPDGPVELIPECEDVEIGVTTAEDNW